jgi:outer membrane protein W
MTFKHIISTTLFVFTGYSVFSQSYISNRSKYHFAQGAMGLDFQYISRTGLTKYTSEGKTKEYAFGGYTVPRIVIGGLHFWGHADIAFNIPVGEIGKKQDSIALNYSDFDIMTFKYYPWAIKKNKVRPYLGTSVNINTFAQQGSGVYNSVYGGKVYKLGFPINAGISYQIGNWLINADAKFNFNRNRTIYTSRTETNILTLPGSSVSFGVRKLFESTAPKFEKQYADGTMKKDYEDNQHKLNAFSFGLGISTNIYTAIGAYNDVNRKFLSKHPGTAFPEFGLGYYINKPDIQINLAYRKSNTTEQGFGIVQQFSRQSLTLEAYKFLFDYKGFVPFAGFGIGKENLQFIETDFGKLSNEASGSKIAPNVTFGWDIRYHRLNWLMLRTNMRYYPNLSLNSPKGKIKFDQIEMNFIQAVVYPQRFKYIKKK